MPVIVESNTPKEERDEWRTLPALYKALDAEFKFQYDFAASKENALAPRYFTKEHSALDHSWFYDLDARPSGFLNPPFSMFMELMTKANEQVRCAGAYYGYATVVCLVKADAPETKWWRTNVLNEEGIPRHEIRYLYPRVPHCNPDGTIRKGITFPSVLVIMRPKPWNYVRWIDWRTLTKSS